MGLGSKVPSFEADVGFGSKIPSCEVKVGQGMAVEATAVPVDAEVEQIVIVRLVLPYRKGSQKYETDFRSEIQRKSLQ